MSSRYEIHSLSDFLSVPEDDLPLCLDAFRRAIRATKATRADAERAGEPAQSIRLECFVWEPRKRPISENPHALTPIESMGLRPRAVERLREINVYCLEDLAEVSETEILRIPDVGTTTVAQLRERLKHVGMDFKENPHPVGALNDRNRLSRRIPIEQRAASISDDSHIEKLGLSQGTFSRALSRHFATVGDLRSLSLPKLCLSFGKEQAREIIATLKAVGQPLHVQPSQVDLWHFGLLNRDELIIDVSAATKLEELTPWLGRKAIDAFKKAGLQTTADLAKAVTDGGLARLPGVGKQTSLRIEDFLRQHHLFKTDSVANRS